ncbi:hypothetical protein Slin15195_G023590 [Septoria linicola]|uniref:Uncharacterized protein n=1 Tax=Septoria linicola TaxID=215465 RepID=A0A9Q9AH85_9PEZI|nr:hypothetical protein Slin14017_G022670 [Septoria linicola]USW49040.1 hypothetical protein Slin15195_G023590 [Septoria linicola]
MSASKEILAILSQVIDEYGDRLKIHGGSKVLVSDGTIAKALFEVTEPVRTPFGPILTVASQEQPDPAQVEGIPNAQVVAADKLDMDHYTHAVFGVSGEDPKYIFGGIKHTIYALQPKGYAIVISLKQETKQAADGEFQVSLDDKMKYQSKGRINNLEECLIYAGFERGRVKGFQQMAEVDGKQVEAQVFLAMKWDQLTA